MARLLTGSSISAADLGSELAQSLDQVRFPLGYVPYPGLLFRLTFPSIYPHRPCGIGSSSAALYIAHIRDTSSLCSLRVGLQISCQAYCQCAHDGTRANVLTRQSIRTMSAQSRTTPLPQTETFRLVVVV